MRLWTLDGRAISLLYFWGLTLTAQAAITPSLGQTFPDPRYFMFWGMHFLAIWASVYLVCLVGGPGWSGYRLTLWCTAVWAAVVLAFSRATGQRRVPFPQAGDLVAARPVRSVAGVRRGRSGRAGCRVGVDALLAGRCRPHGPRTADAAVITPQSMVAGVSPHISLPGALRLDLHERTTGEQRTEASGQEEW